MAKFIEVETYFQGHSHIEILNIDDIGHISVGPNLIFLKTPYADGSNKARVSSETIEKLEKLLEVVEVDDAFVASVVIGIKGKATLHG